MIKSTYDPVKEQPPVPVIPALFSDSICRVCSTPPDSLCTINHITTDVIHVFPWISRLSTGQSGGQSPVTYGLLSKVPSPKEVRDRTKQAMEKKKNAANLREGATAKGEEEVKEEKAMVVRAVCHGIDMLTEKQGSKGEIYSGRVWVSVMCNKRIYDKYTH